MNPVLAVFRRELKSYFLTPVAYVFIIIFLVVASWFGFGFGGRGGGGFGGGPGGGGGGRGGDGPDTELGRARRELRTLIQSEGASAEDIASRLAAFRAARDKANAELAAART